MITERAVHEKGILVHAGCRSLSAAKEEQRSPGDRCMGLGNYVYGTAGTVEDGPVFATCEV